MAIRMLESCIVVGKKRVALAIVTVDGRRWYA